MKKTILGISLAVVLLISAVVPALAQEGATDTTVQGTVQTIDAATCSFTILTAEGTTVTVTMPEGTDCSTLLVGDNVEVTGTLNEDGTLSANAVVVLPPVEEEEEKVNTGHYCSTEGSAHPALSRLAEAYAADYGQLLDLFCGGGLGVGGVSHTLNTSEEFGVSQEEVLALRETMGWGQVWKTLKAAAEGDEGEDEVSEEHGNGNGNGNGNGHGNGNGGNNGNNGNGGGNGNGNGNGKKD